MSQKQLQRIVVVEKAMEGRINVGRAAELLQCSRRQIQRLKQRFDGKDAGWVQHGNRDRKPVNRVSEPTRQRVVARGKYAGFNDSHLRDKLAREENLVLSRSTVRRILRQAGLHSPQKRRPAKYRKRRERRPQEGMLLQVDASRHAWLEQRGPQLTLLGFVDDATGKVAAAQFQAEPEDSAGYLRLLRSLVEQTGIPLAIYRDRHGSLQRNDEHWSVEEQLEGRQLPTQVGRALEELGVEVLVAYTPPAKGRVERFWRTAQDRLVSELRLAGARTLEQANAVLRQFIADFNQQFAKPPQQAGSAYRKLDRRVDLDQILSLRYERTVSKDHVIRVGPGVAVQLPPLPEKRGFANRKVLVCHLPDGRLRVYLEGRLLLEQAADPWAGPVRAMKMNRRRAPRKKKPLRIYTFAGRPALRC